MHAPPLRDSLTDQGTVGGGGDGRERGWVLVVEDDVPMMRTLECYFSARGLMVVAAATITDAKRLYAAGGDWAFVMSDYHLPDGNGWDFCCWVRRQSGAPPFLLISGSPKAASYAMQVSFLAKPFSIGQLDLLVGELLGPMARLTREVSDPSKV